MIETIEARHKWVEQDVVSWRRARRAAISFVTPSDLAAFEEYVTDATNVFVLSTGICQIHGVSVNGVYARRGERIVTPDYFRREGVDFTLRGIAKILPLRPLPLAATFAVVRYEPHRSSAVESRRILISGEEIDAKVALNWEFDFEQIHAVLGVDAQCAMMPDWVQPWLRPFVDKLFDWEFTAVVARLVDNFERDKRQIAT